MTTYYVRKAGNDSNAGTSTGAAWLTVDKAASTATAGDTVYIGAGIYRELVTLDNSGSSGSVISFVCDVDGKQTGDAGLVIITAHDDDTVAATRVSCLDVNGKTFWKLSQLMFTGGTSFVVGNTTSTANLAYEGCEISDCTISSVDQVDAIKLELNNGVTPTENGLQILRNHIYNGIDLDWDSNGSANNNLKIVIDSNIIFATYAGTGLEFTRSANGGSFTPGGITITNNTWWCAAHAISTNNLANTTNPLLIFGNLFAGCQNAMSDSLSASGYAVASNNRFWNVFTWYASGITVYPDEGLTQNINSNILLGGIHDALLLKKFGFTPYRFLEPMEFSGYTNPAISKAPNNYSLTSDVYSNNREMGRPSQYANLYYFDGSDAAATDPNSVWTNDTNITNVNLASSASVNTTGSTSSNYIMAEGTNAPSSGGTIQTVKARFLHDTASGTDGGEITFYTDGLGESLGAIAVSSGTTDAWSAWTDLSTPSGGWTWSKVQALEFKAYRTSGSAAFRIYSIEIGVITNESAPDCGAVEAKVLATIDSTFTYNSLPTLHLAGGSIFMDFVEVENGVETTITCQSIFDSNYSGTKPQMKVINIPGVSDQTDTAVGSANSWEALSVTFTPTSDALVGVVYVSNDVSTNGNCGFVQAVPTV